MALLDLTNGFPAIGPNQELVHTTHRYGKIMKWGRPRRRTPKQARDSWWLTYMRQPIAFLNRRLTKGLSAYWKNTLTTAQRNAWKAAATTASWTNYKGTVTTPNGFQLWIATQRFRRYSLMYPYYNGGNLFTPTEVLHGYTVEFPSSIIPTPWSQPAPPDITYTEVIDGYWIYLEFNAPPDPYNMYLETAQALNFNPPTPRNPKRYMVAWNVADMASSPPYAGIFFDFPKPEETPRPSVRLGLRFHNTATNQFSEPVWILATS